MHSIDDIAEAITQKTILLLATTDVEQRDTEYQHRLQQLIGMCELAGWLEQRRLERKLEAQIARLQKNHAAQYRTHVTMTITLTTDQAWQYAQCLKRTGFNDYRNQASNDDEAYLMRDAGERLRRALAEQGYEPR